MDNTDYDFTKSSRNLPDEDRLTHREMRRLGRERMQYMEDVSDVQPRMDPAELHSLSQLGLQEYKKRKNPADVMYDWDLLEEMALKAIVDYNLIFVKEVAAYIPAAYQTAVNKGFFKRESIQSALQENRVKSKVRLRNNWMDPDAAAQLQLSAYKLMADDDERQKLGSYHKGEYTSKQSLQINVNFNAEDFSLESDPIDITPHTLIDGEGEEE
jgi:hypothetical protein